MEKITKMSIHRIYRIEKINEMSDFQMDCMTIPHELSIYMVLVLELETQMDVILVIESHIDLVLVVKVDAPRVESLKDRFFRCGKSVRSSFT